MSERSQSLPIVLWFLGGLSIVVVGMQAALGLLGIRYLDGVPVVGAFVHAVTSLAVFDRAAMVTFQARGTVFGLFLLVLVSWLGGLATMIDGRARRRLEPARSWCGGALAVAILAHVALYLGVYGSLASGTVPAYQLPLLYVLPIGSIGMLAAGWFLFPWRQDRLDEIVETFERAERVAENQRDTFEERLTDEVGLTEDRLAAITGTGGAVSFDLTSLERSIQTFREESDEIRREAGREADRLSSMGREDVEEPLDSKRRSADRLLERAEELDPSGSIETISRELTNAGEAIYTEYFSSIEAALQSQYGARYAVSNLPDEYARMSADVPGGSIELGDDESEMRDRLRAKISADSDGDKPAIAVLMDGIGVLERVQNHVNETVRPHLTEVETEFVERSRSIEADLEVVEKRLEGLEGPPGKTLRRILVEGEGEETLGVPDVHEALEAARNALHDCRFESSDGVYRTLDEVESMVEDLQRCVLFVEGIFLQAIVDGESRVALRYGPSDYEHPFFTDDLLAALEDPILDEFGASYAVDVVEGEIRIDYEDARDVAGTGIDDDERKIQQSVTYIVDRVGETEPTDEGDVLEFDVATVPEYVLRPGVMNRLADFFATSEAVTAENVPAEGESGPIRLRANGEMNMGTALRTLREEHEEWAEDR